MQQAIVEVKHSYCQDCGEYKEAGRADVVHASIVGLEYLWHVVLPVPHLTD